MDPRTVEPTDLDRRLLELAIAEAEAGAAEGGIPVGAALAVGEEVVATGRNRRVQVDDPILHGEMDCLSRAGRLPASAYRRATLATTLSPCDMCTGAIILFGIPRVVVGEERTFRGPTELLRARGVEVVVVDDPRCVVLMERFIRRSPELWAEDIAEDPRVSDLGGAVDEAR